MKCVIHEMRRFGVSEVNTHDDVDHDDGEHDDVDHDDDSEKVTFIMVQVFEVEDLMELKNIPKVCKAVARLCRLVRFNFDLISHSANRILF